MTILYLLHTMCIAAGSSLLVSFQAFLSRLASHPAPEPDIYKVVWDVSRLVFGYEVSFVIAASPGYGVIGLVWKPFLTARWVKCQGGSRQLTPEAPLL